MRRHRRAKIVATLGPASSNPDVIENLFQSGVDVFRLNFSHGSHQDHQANYETIRNLEVKTGRPIPILMDLQGPKLRIGTFKGGQVNLKTGQEFQFFLDSTEGDETKVQLPHPQIFQALVAGTELLLDDGRVRVRVMSVTEKKATCEVIVGGPLSDRKGLNIPGIRLPISALTDKDRQDLAFGLELGADWIALSFVQHPDDIKEAREIIKGQALLVAKLEKPEAIEHLEEIIHCSDALMVARGDLGVEMPPEDVPIIQKRIIEACRRAGKPVIVATQMLESMVSSPSPTRAEASDVATAIYEEADAVMLSAESASGQYPIEAVTMMDRIIRRVEEDPAYNNSYIISQEDSSTSLAITAATRQVAESVNAAVVATFTTTGNTSFLAAKARPSCPILGVTPSIKVARQLNLAWGVHPIQSQEITSLSEAVSCALEVSTKEGFAMTGDRLVITAGVPFRVAGSTNVIRIAEVRD
jgi:pyruvate kinase